MGAVFTYRMPAGIAGQVTRELQSTTEVQIIDAANPPTAFGQPLVMDAATSAVRPFIASDTAGSIYGWLVRPYPSMSPPNLTGVLGNYPLGSVPPLVSGMCNVLVRGYFGIIVNGTTAAAKDGSIFIRTQNAGTNKPVGFVEAAADNSAISTATVGAGGASYQVGDVLTLAGGVGGTVTVTTVSSGAVTGISITTGGTGYTVTNGVATTGGHGTGATINVTALALNTIVLPKPPSYFVGPADANNLAEIAFNI